MRKIPRRYRPATGPATVCAVALELGGAKALSIERIWQRVATREPEADVAAERADSAVTP